MSDDVSMGEISDEFGVGLCGASLVEEFGARDDLFDQSSTGHVHLVQGAILGRQEGCGWGHAPYGDGLFSPRSLHGRDDEGVVGGEGPWEQVDVPIVAHDVQGAGPTTESAGPNAVASGAAPRESFRLRSPRHHPSLRLSDEVSHGTRPRGEKPENRKDLPHVVPLTGTMRKRWGEGTILVPALLEVDAVTKRVRKGKLITVNMIRDALARRQGADMSCPTTAGGLNSIAAHAAAGWGEEMVDSLLAHAESHG